MVARVPAFTVAVAVGVAPAFTTPTDGTALFVLHPSTTWFAKDWEPPRTSRERRCEGDRERAASLA